ncbi:Chitin synthase, class 5 [Lambiella insularis]|nr:Chitin synthase, class 5 [Lambiella insularis]
MSTNTKKVVRSWINRRLRRAVVEALRANGFDAEGRLAGGEDGDPRPGIKGTLVVHAQSAAQRAKFVQLKTQIELIVKEILGKVDAGVAVLLTEDKRLIEFPSILLPPSISSGSIVDITVSRNHASENAAHTAFHDLQSSIYSTYGLQSPATPVLRCRNATQTSVVLEWDPITLATASLRSLSLYRNGNKAGSIPRPMDITSTKISGLAIDTEYVFHLVLRTSAGTYTSEKLHVRTHKMTDLTGITVTPGVLPAQLKFSLTTAVERIGGKLVEAVRIDTTHFVCTEGRGREWERAVEMSIPVVRPEWVEGCEREGRIVGVRGYYLNADPRLRQVGQGVGVQRPGAQRRTESQTSIKRMTPAMQTAEGGRHDLGPSTAGTDTSGISPGTAVNGAPSGRMEVMREPPTPPAKDKQPELPTASTVSPPPASVTEESEESEEEEPARGKANHHHQASQPRDLVQSPFDSAHKSPAVLPVRGNTAEAQEAEDKGKLRQLSDGGSFTTVTL